MLDTECGGLLPILKLVYNVINILRIVFNINFSAVPMLSS